MEDNLISINSTKEQIADFFTKNDKYKKDKDILIQEGISGEVLLEASPKLKMLGIKPIIYLKIKKYIEKYKDRFKSKKITEKIDISNEEEIIKFFKKFIDTKDNINFKIKSENELLELSEEDMKKFGLNLGKRIILNRYINHFKNLNIKNKMKENKIIISINKDSTEDEVNNFLRNTLFFSEKALECGFDAQILFEITEEDINNFSCELNQKEKDMLKIFILVRDENMKQNSNKIIKNITNDEIEKILREKLKINIENDDINKIDSDKYDFKNLDNNIQNNDNNIFQEIKTNYNKVSNDDFYQKKISSFNQESKYNIFFIILIEKESLKNIEIETYQKTGFLKVSINKYNSYLIHISKSYFNNWYYCLYQIISNIPISNITIQIKDIDYEDFIFKANITIEQNNLQNFFIIDEINFDDINDNSSNYFMKMSDNDLFSVYLNYFFNEKNKFKNNLIQKNLIQALNEKLANNKNIELSGTNILKFLNYCIKLNIEPKNLENIKFIAIEKVIDNKYYVSKNFTRFSSKIKNQLFSIIFQIYSFYDIENLIKEISSNEDDCCKILLNLLFRNPIKIKLRDLKKRMNEIQINNFQSCLFKFSETQEDIENLSKMNNNIENQLYSIFKNSIYIIPRIVKIITNQKEIDIFNGIDLVEPNIKDNIKQISKYIFKIDSD